MPSYTQIKGDFISKDFKLIPNNPIDEIVTVVPSRNMDCCGDFVWRVLADVDSTDEHKNDINSFLFWFNQNSTPTAKVYLVDVKDNANEIDLTSNTDYGTPYNYGFEINEVQEKLVGYQIEWKKVIDTLGGGQYYIKCEITDLFGITASTYSDVYCMKQYTIERANKTVKIEYYIKGILGDSNFDEKRRNYGTLNWYNSHRFDGFFMYENSEYVEEYVQYENGQFDPVKLEQTPAYLLNLRPIAKFKHDVLRNDVYMANEILVTDYNVSNIEPYVQKKVKFTGAYDPNFYPMKSKLSSVTIKCTQEYNNLKKFRN